MTFAIQTLSSSLAMALSAMACMSPAPTSLESPVELFLKVGETARLRGNILRLTFEEVSRDSRCPKDAFCVTAGEAEVLLTAQSNEKETPLVFRIPPGGGDAKAFEDFTITIKALEPQTESGKSIDPEDYTVEVVVEQS